MVLLFRGSPETEENKERINRRGYCVDKNTIRPSMCGYFGCQHGGLPRLKQLKTAQTRLLLPLLRRQLPQPSVVTGKYQEQIFMSTMHFYIVQQIAALFAQLSSEVNTHFQQPCLVKMAARDHQGAKTHRPRLHGVMVIHHVSELHFRASLHKSKQTLRCDFHDSI